MNSETKKNSNNNENLFLPFGKEALDKSIRLILNNRILQIAFAAQILIIVILLFSYFNLSKALSTNISLPPYGKFNVARMQADPLYFRVWGDYVLNLYSNFTPINIQSKVEEATRVFDHETYIAFAPQFESYYQAIKTNQITQKFIFNEEGTNINISASGSEATLTYNGTAIQKIGDFTIRRKKCFYEMHFFIENYNIYQDSIKTDCLNDDSVVPKKVAKTNTQKAEHVQKHEKKISEIDNPNDLEDYHQEETKTKNETIDATIAPKDSEKNIDTAEGNNQKDFTIKLNEDDIFSGLNHKIDAQSEKSIKNPLDETKTIGQNTSTQGQQEVDKKTSINLNENEKAIYEQ